MSQGEVTFQWEQISPSPPRAQLNGEGGKHSNTGASLWPGRLRGMIGSIKGLGGEAAKEASIWWSYALRRSTTSEHLKAGAILESLWLKTLEITLIGAELYWAGRATYYDNNWKTRWRMTGATPARPCGSPELTGLVEGSAEARA